jgi:hypothetical protein
VPLMEHRASILFSSAQRLRLGTHDAGTRRPYLSLLPLMFEHLNRACMTLWFVRYGLVHVFALC